MIFRKIDNEENDIKEIIKINIRRLRIRKKNKII